MYLQECYVAHWCSEIVRMNTSAKESLCALQPFDSHRCVCVCVCVCVRVCVCVCVLDFLFFSFHFFLTRILSSCNFCSSILTTLTFLSIFRFIHIILTSEFLHTLLYSQTSFQYIVCCVFNACPCPQSHYMGWE